MHYLVFILSAVVIGLLVVNFNLKQKLIPCERCGTLGSTEGYFGPPDHPVYEKKLKLCSRCRYAHDKFLHKQYMLSVYNRLSGAQRMDEVSIDRVVLVEIAKEDPDLVRRVLTDECFESIKPWLMGQISDGQANKDVVSK